MDFHLKIQWTVRLSKTCQEFEVLFKEGKHKPYITVKNDEAVHFLTTEGFEDIVLEVPRDNERYTKIILFDYPTYLDPEDVLVDDMFHWVKRREIKSNGKTVPKPQLIGLFKGSSPPEKIFVKCLGYKRIAVYNENPILCHKCSKWGHMAYKCHNDYRCRYCGDRHDSKICAEKIKEKNIVSPKCCNCGADHNANSRLCPKRPQDAGSRQNTRSNNLGDDVPQGSKTTSMKNNVNVWQGREEQMVAAMNQVDQSGNLTDVRGNDAAAEIADLRKEIEDLKLVVYEIQKTLTDFCVRSTAKDLLKKKATYLLERRPKVRRTYD